MNASNTPDDDLDLGLRLRAIREGAGLSQRALAKKAAVTNSTISLIEGVAACCTPLRQLAKGHFLPIVSPLQSSSGSVVQ